MTLRAILLGLLLIPLNTYWVQYSEAVHELAHATMASLFFNCVFTLLGLVVLNAGLRRILPRQVLTAAELLVIYVMLCVATAVAGHDQTEVLVPVMSYVFHFATPENQWEQRLWKYVPSHLTVSDPEVIKGFWEGHSTLYTRERLLAWAGPMGLWVGFVFTVLTVMLCINLILRPRWTEQERLPYPLVELPVQIARAPEALFRQRWLWIGFAAAGGIDLLNGFHFLYPWVPHVQVTCYDLAPYLSGHSWGRALGWMPVAFYPFAFGLGCLLPRDFLLSCWFFFWIWKGEQVWGVLRGDTASQFPFMREQSFGAYLGLCVFPLWMARRYLADLGRRAASGRATRGEYGALVGLLLGGAAVMAFALSGGLSWGAAAAFFGFYFALSTAIARMRGEMGLPAHDLMASGPETMMVSVLGPDLLGPRNLTMFSLLWWMNRAHRSHPMPHQLEGLEIGRRQRVAPGPLVGAILLAGLAGAVAGIWGMLHIGYTQGMGLVPSDASYFGLEPYARLAAWLTYPREPDLGAAAAIGFGHGFTLLLLALRARFVWWPFHPIGYAVSSSLSMHLLWLPMLGAWLLKGALLRYGGLRLYRQAVPFFLGLILGDFVVGGGWSLVGTFLGLRTYRFWSY